MVGPVKTYTEREWNLVEQAVRKHTGQSVYSSFAMISGERLKKQKKHYPTLRAISLKSAATLAANSGARLHDGASPPSGAKSRSS